MGRRRRRQRRLVVVVLLHFIIPIELVAKCN
jgi:hypothetical protein